MRVIINQVWGWVGWATLVLVLSSCVAQQAELVELKRGLEKKIALEKKALKKTIDQDKEESNRNLGDQRAKLNSQINESRKARAQIKNDLRSFREDLSAELNNKIEEEVHRTQQQVEQKVGDVRQEVMKKVVDLSQRQDQRDNERATQITELHAKVDDFATKVEQALEKQSQFMGTAMAEFGDSLNGFKKALEGLDKRLDERVLQERNRASKAEAQLKEDFEGKQAAFTKKLDADTQALRTYLEQDVRASLTSIVKAVEKETNRSVQKVAQLETLFQGLEKKIGSDVAGLQGEVKSYEVHVQELNQTVGRLHEALESVAGRLSKRGDDRILQLGQLSERLNRFEQNQLTLADEVKANAQATSSHLSKVTTSFQSLAQVLDQVKGNLDTRVEEQAQQIGRLSETLATLEQNQSALVGKVDTDSQTLGEHLNEVNTSITSVAKALEQVKASLTSRIEDQERRLTESAAALASMQTLRGELANNVEHLNELTRTVAQLRDVVDSIGTKMGARVDRHDRDLAGLDEQLKRIQEKGVGSQAN